MGLVAGLQSGIQAPFYLCRQFFGKVLIYLETE